jgi:hypothetical protein
MDSTNQLIIQLTISLVLCLEDYIIPTLKNVEGIVRGLIKETVAAYAWRGW